MHNRTKKMLLVIGEHCLFVALSLFLVYTFMSLFNKYMYVVSFITAILYITSTYSAGWTNSKKELAIAKEEIRLSNNPEGKPTYSVYSGFLTALPNLLIALCLTFMALTKGELWEVFYRLYSYSFIYIITDKVNDFVVWKCVLCAVLPYLAYSLGYIAGKDKKIFFIKYIPKIIYKPNKD